MIPDGEYTAVVDRIEDGLATLEVHAEERAALTVDPADLPADAGADAVLRVTVADGALVEAVYDPDGTAERAESAQDRFDRLSRRPPGREHDPD